MANRLAGETSPYLQQHADNPVDWYPWGEEALDRARAENKPILLSIGYSACHWCHVMAHESFEDADTAAVMNRLFVNIKVDREERPDLDQIYQSAHQMLAQRAGGWPLTMFLMPDGVPFYGGTYFPKRARHGLPSFVAMLERVADVLQNKRGEIEQQNQAVLAAFARMNPGSGVHHSELSAVPVDAAVAMLGEHFDPRHGGFGAAPKFPHPTDLALLLRHHGATGDAFAREMALATLSRMAEGGIHDQLGGGFCRYSVDERWDIPHFEKMLYDNGPLLRLYADAWALTGDALYRQAAEGIAHWALREMRTGDGAFCSSLDADSEHEEGKFYVWTPDAVRALLGADEYALAAAHYGLDGPANFEGAHWHLRVARPLGEVCENLGLALADGERLLASVRAKLFAARETRVRPGRDDKVLTSWNALMIGGLAHAARVFGRDDWLAAARAALAFVRERMWRDERLLATAKDGRAHLAAYLDDHAFLIEALIELMQARFEPSDLAFAEDLAEALLDRYQDREGGGFYFTAHDHERLIHRPKSGHDGAMASGNAVAALALQRLGWISGEQRYLDAAERTLALFHAHMAENPSGYAALIAALAEWLSPPKLVCVRGPAAEVSAWCDRLHRQHLPDTILLGLPDGLGALPPPLAKPVGTRVNAFVCRGVMCLPPITEPAELERVCATPIPG